METKATVNVIGETKAGISQRTGNEWKSCQIMLEWIDSEGTHRAWAALFNEQMESFVRQGIGTNDSVTVRLRFSARSFRNGFVNTEVMVEEINKINQ